MITKLENIKSLIGNSPLKKMEFSGANLFAKLEYTNYSGSVKDRAAFNIMLEAVKNGNVDEHTTIVESSSGNFAVALAYLCRELGLRFIPVIDPNINAHYEKLLQILCHDIVKVNVLDKTGGYLLTRIETVKEICDREPNVFWTNQYQNPFNYLGYYDTLGAELCNSFETLDYAFVCVSSGGTITGVSRKLKEKFTNVKIVAVDVEGSVIFGNCPQKRYITGLGSSMVPEILEAAMIDEVILVPQLDIIKGCYELLDEQQIFAGASSGAAYQAVKEFFAREKRDYLPNAVFICADRGNAYMDTIYNADWVDFIIEKISTSAVAGAH